MRIFEAEAAHRQVNKTLESQDVEIRKSRDQIVAVPTNPGVLYTSRHQPCSMPIKEKKAQHAAETHQVALATIEDSDP
jgi:hypothetical protein